MRIEGDRMDELKKAKGAPLCNVPVDALMVCAPAWIGVNHCYSVAGYPVKSVSLVGTVISWREAQLNDVRGILCDVESNGVCSVFQLANVR